jgi:predicted nicotinamide N-methyase
MPAPTQFILNNTARAAPPLVPEIRLHIGGDVVTLWKKVEEEQGVEGIPPPYWAYPWPGGQAMARYLLDRPECIRGGKALDFGAGSGLIAIAAAKCGATAVAAEIDTLAAAAITLNAEENEVSVAVLCEDVIGRSGWDAILVGDMCYERPLAERLTAWLAVEAKRGVLILIGDPGRTYFPETGPESGLEKLASYTVPTNLDLEDRKERETGVYRLR